MRKLDEEMRRTDELLYQMIPKQVADRLRTGENPIDTCQVIPTYFIDLDLRNSLDTDQQHQQALHMNTFKSILIEIMLEEEEE